MVLNVFLHIMQDHVSTASIMAKRQLKQFIFVQKSIISIIPNVIVQVFIIKLVGTSFILGTSGFVMVMF